MHQRPRSSARLAWATVLAAPSVSSPAFAQCETGALPAPPPSSGDQIGTGVALSGDWACVTAALANGNTGRAWVFQRSGGAWGMPAAITPIDLQPGDFFGICAAMDGEALAVGANWHDTGTHFLNDEGAVYMYRRSGGAWMLEDKLLSNANGMNFSQEFGTSVDIDGDVLVVGATKDDQITVAGAVYVFRYVGGAWTLEDRLVPSGLAQGALLGMDVAVDGDVIVASTRNDPTNALTNSGVIYVWRNVGGIWQEQGELRGSEASDGDRFGHALDLADDRILAGAYLNPLPPPSTMIAGAVYAFDFIGSAWSQTDMFRTPIALSNGSDGIGRSIDIEGDLALVGAQTASSPVVPFATGFGLLYRHDGQNWEHQGTLAPLAGPLALAGASVDLDGDQAILGAPGESTIASFGGAAFSFGTDTADTPFGVDPSASTIEFTFTIPGFGTVTETVDASGFFDTVISGDCVDPTQIQVLDFRLATVDPQVTVTLGPFSVTATDVAVVMSRGPGGPGSPAMLGPAGAFTQTVDVEWRGTVEYDVLGLNGTYDLSTEPPEPLDVVGVLTSGGASHLSVDIDIDDVIDIGLGALNPTMGALGDVEAPEIGACYPDCDGNGSLDIFDFLCFQDAFVQMDPYADCDGTGAFDIFDFLCFQDAFVVGCP